jgi:hypothetical protein
LQPVPTLVVFYDHDGTFTQPNFQKSQWRPKLSGVVFYDHDGTTSG